MKKTLRMRGLTNAPLSCGKFRGYLRSPRPLTFSLRSHSVCLCSLRTVKLLERLISNKLIILLGLWIFYPWVSVRTIILFRISTFSKHLLEHSFISGKAGLLILPINIYFYWNGWILPCAFKF